MLLVAGKYAALGEKRDISESVLFSIRAVKKRRNVDDDFRVPLRNQFEPLAVPIIPDAETRGIVLVNEVGAQLLLQARRDGDQAASPSAAARTEPGSRAPASAR
jgi:hypothetical protein